MASVRAQIYDALVTALGTIKVVNGYNTTLTSAQKVLARQTDSGRPYVIASFRRESTQDEEGISTVEDYRGNLHFRIYAFPEEVREGDATSVEDQIDDLLSDVEKLLAAENAKNPPLNVTGAKDIILHGHDKYDVGTAYVQGVTLHGVIKYARAADDPDTPA